VLHGLYPRTPMSEAVLRAIVRRLNSMPARFARHGRVYQGGLRKFEPSDLAEVPFDNS
jgi:hypothetical protein